MSASPQLERSICIFGMVCKGPGAVRCLQCKLKLFGDLSVFCQGDKTREGDEWRREFW